MNASRQRLLLGSAILLWVTAIALGARELWHYSRTPGKLATTPEMWRRCRNGYVERFNGRMRDELLNEGLFFSLDHRRMERSLQNREAAFLAQLPDPGRLCRGLHCSRFHVALNDGFASPPVAQPAPYGVTETAEAQIAAG